MRDASQVFLFLTSIAKSRCFSEVDARKRIYVRERVLWLCNEIRNDAGLYWIPWILYCASGSRMKGGTTAKFAEKNPPRQIWRLIDAGRAFSKFSLRLPSSLLFPRLLYRSYISMIIYREDEYNAIGITELLSAVVDLCNFTIIVTSKKITCVFT